MPGIALATVIRESFNVNRRPSQVAPNRHGDYGFRRNSRRGMQGDGSDLSVIQGGKIEVPQDKVPQDKKGGKPGEEQHDSHRPPDNGHQNDGHQNDERHHMSEEHREGQSHDGPDRDLVAVDRRVE